MRVRYEAPEMERLDAELIEAVQRGDQAALDTLLALHAPEIYRFGVRMCRDPEDAKDVLQETLLAAARGLREFRGASSLSTWLYTIARSFCIKRRRASKRSSDAWVSIDREPAVAEIPSTEVPPDDAVADRQLGAALGRAIRALPPMYREVLVLRDVEGLTAVEVAEVLGLTVDAVKSRLHRARSDVRSKVARFLPGAGSADQAPPSGACPDIVALFSRYVEEEIGPDECAAMERHIASCKRCSVACDSLKSTLLLCQAERGREIPNDVQARVRQAIRAIAGPHGGLL